MISRSVRGRLARLAATLGALWLLLAASASALPDTGRKLTPDDLFRMEDLGDVAFSPDGNWLAYVVKRSKSVTFHKWDYLDGNDRGDVWLVATRGGEPRNLTQGVSDGAGFWQPSFSPDGGKIAMLSTRGGDVRVWVWDRATDRVTRGTTRAVEPWHVSPRISWTTDSALVVPTLPEGKRSLAMVVETQTQEEATRQWARSYKGAEPSVSVLRAGASADFEKRPLGQIELVDSNGGATRVLASAPQFSEVRVSPDGKRFAALRQTGVYRPDVGKPLPLLSTDLSGAVIGSLEKDGSVQKMTGARDVLMHSLRWSPDGESIAFLGRAADSSEDLTRLFRCRTRPVVCAVAAPDLDPTPPIYGETGLVWSSKGELLVQAKPRAPSRNGEQPSLDWWLVGKTGSPRPVISASRAVPGITRVALSEIVADPTSDAIWGVSDGRLLRVPLDGSAPRPMAGGADPKIASIVWPQMDTRIRGRLERLIVGVPKDASIDLYVFDVASGSLKRIERPSPDAELAVCSYDGSRIAFKSAVRDGTFLWISDVASGRATKILETNTFLREIAEGVLKPIAYRSSEGEDLKGWILLPPGYREGERYPTIVEVYAGYLYGDKPPYLARLNLSHALNHQLLAAHGYAVLFPSMPLTAEGTASDPYMELSKGVLPAVDRAIELGYTDPKRLGVMGQSFGGFSTYGLVTQTRRFGAAISMAGLSDFISLYGVLDARVRYTDTAEENLFQMALFETGQTRMGNPPWKDIGRYLRNSPLFYVDRVQTPLMIIQGDMDYVAMQQGEQFFTALYRQGKRAELVRYWGEGHVLEGPANIRDMWQRIYGWFDENLKKPDGAGAEKAAAR